MATLIVFSKRSTIYFSSKSLPIQYFAIKMFNFASKYMGISTYSCLSLSYSSLYYFGIIVMSFLGMASNLIHSFMKVFRWSNLTFRFFDLTWFGSTERDAATNSCPPSISPTFRHISVKLGYRLDLVFLKWSCSMNTFHLFNCTIAKTYYLADFRYSFFVKHSFPILCIILISLSAALAKYFCTCGVSFSTTPIWSFYLNGYLTIISIGRKFKEHDYSGLWRTVGSLSFIDWITLLIVGFWFCIVG